MVTNFLFLDKKRTKFEGKGMKDKKAWLKVMEAVIAILIIIGAVVFIMAGSAPKKDISSIAYEKEKYILDLISKNYSLRSDILNNNNLNVNNTIIKMIPLSWDFETRICGIDDLCEGLRTPIDREIYASEIVVTSVNTKYEPKKIRMFVWSGVRPPPPLPMTIRDMSISPTWIDGGEIPAQYRDSGGNTPIINISNIPANTKSLLLIFEKDVPATDTDYALNWIVWNITYTGSEMIVDSSASFLGRNSENHQHQYKGPKSSNPGTYKLTVYSLDIEIPGILLDPETPAPDNRNTALSIISDHIIQAATITGTVS